MNIDDRPTTERPISGPIHTYWKISNGHNSATCQPIPSCLVLGWGFRGWRLEWRHFRLYPAAIL